MLKHENGWERGHTFEYAGGPRLNWHIQACKTLLPEWVFEMEEKED